MFSGRALLGRLLPGLYPCPNPHYKICLSLAPHSFAGACRKFAYELMRNIPTRNIGNNWQPVKGVWERQPRKTFGRPLGLEDAWKSYCSSIPTPPPEAKCSTNQYPATLDATDYR